MNSTNSETDIRNLLDRIGIEAGVSRSLWEGAFLPTLLEIRNSKGPGCDEEKALLELQYIMRRRRDLNLPCGIAPEDYHLARDRWSFIVFLVSSILLYKVDLGKASNYQRFIQPAQVVSWLSRDNQSQIVIESVLANEAINRTSRLIRGIIDKEPHLAIVAPPAQLRVLLPTYDKTEKVAHTSERKEEGVQFFSWLMSRKDSLPEWATLEDTVLSVESPRGFIEYAKTREVKWQALQKGVKKLKIHILDDRAILHRVGKKNVMKFDISSMTL